MIGFAGERVVVEPCGGVFGVVMLMSFSSTRRWVRSCVLLANQFLHPSQVPIPLLFFHSFPLSLSFFLSIIHTWHCTHRTYDRYEV